jgi:hypothetical protein
MGGRSSFVRSATGLLIRVDMGLICVGDLGYGSSGVT